MTHRILKLSIFVLGLIIISCGIPSDAYLYPPKAITSFNINDERMVFRNSTENNSTDIEFVGYLLFYRMYSGTTELDQNDYQDYGETYLTSSIINNNFDIENEQGIYSTTQRISLFKVIEVNNTYEDEDFDVTLDFQDIASNGGADNNATIGYSGGDVTIGHLYRSFKRSGSWESVTYYFSDDSSDYVSGDTDLPSDFSSGMRCAMWVVSYGYNLSESIQNIYSEPVYIGNFEIRFFSQRKVSDVQLLL